MKSFSIEYRWTPADLKYLFDSRPRSLWFRGPRIILGGLVLVSAGWHAFRYGLDTSAVLQFVFGCWLGLADFLIDIPLRKFLQWRMATYTISVVIDDDVVAVETVTPNSKPHQQKIPWTSFIQYGKVTEDAYAFRFESGRGGVFIPKRALSTEQETNFRQIVREKMGDR